MPVAIVSLILFLIVGLLKIRSKGSKNHPVILVTVWWLFWMSVSAFGCGGLDIPDLRTYLVFLCFIVAMVAGSCFQNPLKTNQPSISRRKKEANNVDTMLRFVSIVLLFIVVITFIASRSALKMTDSVRSAALMRSGDVDVIFRYPFLRNCYNFTVQPGIFVVLVSGIWSFIFKNQYFLLAVGAVGSFLNSAIFFGRFGLYSVPVLLLVSLLIAGNRLERGVRRQVLKITAVMLLSSLVLGVSITALRNEGVNSLIDILRQYINYHTAGFVLMDHEITSDGSMLNSERFYGRLTLGPLEDLVSVILRRMNFAFIPAGIEAIEYRENFQEIGSYDGITIYGNAYFTIVFTLIADGGYIYLLLGGFGIGLVLNKFYTSLNCDPSQFNFCKLILFVWLGLFSLFQSVLESRTFWFGALYIVLLIR